MFDLGYQKVHTIKIAIVTASVGHGHNAAALALQEALQNQNPNSCVEVFDILEDSIIYQFFTDVYLEVISKTPHIYSKIYHWTQHHQKPNSIISYLNFICLKSLKKIKQTFQPDAFIFTHPIPSISYSYSLNIPAWTVITDYSYHPIWFNPKIKGYFVANQGVQNQLANNQYPIDSIFVTGLPIKNAFSSPLLDQESLPSNDHKPLILIMGGGLGIGPLKEIVEKLETIDLAFNAVVLTGNNHSLYLDISDTIGSKTTGRWTVLSFTDEIHKLMQRATLLISKAGAITLTEALASGLPTIIYKPIPGQEEDNAHHVCQQGWATWAKNSKELVSLTQALLTSPESLKIMKQKTTKFCNPKAANDIIETISASISLPLRRSI